MSTSFVARQADAKCDFDEATMLRCVMTRHRRRCVANIQLSGACVLSLSWERTDRQQHEHSFCHSSPVSPPMRTLKFKTS